MKYRIRTPDAERNRAFYAVFVDKEKWCESRNFRVFLNDKTKVVENKPAPFEPYGRHRMALMRFIVLDNDKSKIGGGESDFPQRNIFRDRVVLTVSGAQGKRRQRRGPIILDAIAIRAGAGDQGSKETSSLRSRL